MEVIVKNSNNVEYLYQEPVTNKDGSALKDLKETVLYAKVEGQAVAASVAFQPASTPTGGGVQRVAVILPVAEDQEKVVECWVTAKDNAGNEGPASNHVSVEIDRLAPGNPI